MAASHSITVPFVPPSGNHYRVPVWSQRRFYVTKEAKAFKEAIGYLWRVAVRGKAFAVDIKVTLGKGDRLDCDNGAKVVLDGLQEAGAFGNKSDAAVVDLHVWKCRDGSPARTEITVTVL
jgi:Holliday junction resolvase RusA-like endonuclease